MAWRSVCPGRSRFIGLRATVCFSEQSSLASPRSRACSVAPETAQTMARSLPLLFAGLVLTLGGAVATPLSETRPTPKDVARSAVESYNQETVTEVAFKLLQLRNVKRKIFDWGVHFSINFTIKETNCRKPVVYNVQDCKYASKGKIKDCFAEATVLDLMDDAPLTSVECQEQQVSNTKQPTSPSKKKKTKRHPPVLPDDAKVEVKSYISSYSNAALTLPHEGTV